ncbi:MAG: deoxyribodipyrimidine photo-lyase, partial [Pseudohongiellaceae bacterium]
MRTLYWMTHDLRLDDNPALRLAAQSSELAVVTVINPDWFTEGQYGLASVGKHRWQFLQQSLADLSDSLARRGHVLHIFRGNPVSVLAELIEQGQFQRVVTSRKFGSNETAQLAVLDRRFPDVTFSEIDTYTLFNLTGLPMPVSDIPETYSRFRRKVEKMTVEEPRGTPARLPAAIELDRA